MNEKKDLELIYMALEEGEVLRDLGSSWGQEDVSEWGITFEQLLELRYFVLDQDFVINLGFKRLVDSFFDEKCGALLTEEEVENWNSVALSLAFENFAIAMSSLLSGELDSVKELVIKDFILLETASMKASKEIKGVVLDTFKSWKAGEAPNELVQELPRLASL